VTRRLHLQDPDCIGMTGQGSNPALNTELCRLKRTFKTELCSFKDTRQSGDRASACFGEVFRFLCT